MKKLLLILIGALIFSACGYCGDPISERSKYYCKSSDGYYYQGGSIIIYRRIPLEVDKDSFEVLSQGYAKDKDQVFFEFHCIKEANPATFEALSDYFGKDDGHVFWRASIIKQADAASFYVNETGVPMDKNHVFVWNESGYGFIPSPIDLDKDTVEQVESHGVLHMLKDKNGVYWQGSRLPADAESFRARESFWGTCYWEDKNGKYCQRWDHNDRNKIFIVDGNGKVLN